jgi:hypothetical protein
MLDLLIYLVLASVLVFALLRRLLSVVAGAALVVAALAAVLVGWSLLPEYGLLVALPIWIWL